MYEITKGQYAKTFGENKQLYQIIDIDGDSLRFRAFTATGDLHDEFQLQKRTDKPNLLIEKQISFLNLTIILKSAKGRLVLRSEKEPFEPEPYSDGGGIA